MTSPYWDGTARFVSAVEGGMLRRKGRAIRISKRGFLRGHIKKIMASNSLEINPSTQALRPGLKPGYAQG
jgi:hypothetical protein